MAHEERWRPAVRAFNARMAAAGHSGFFESPTPDWLAPAPGSPTYRELFVALDGERAHGGYVLRHERALIAGAERDVASVQGPYSEGAADSRHARTSFALIQDMMRRRPRLYGWGLENRPDMRELFGMFRWRSWASPTLVWWGVPVLRSRHRPPAGVQVTVEPAFGDWADDLWRDAAPAYSFVTGRDAATLRAVYPPGDGDFHRLAVRRDGELIGWAVTGLRRFRRHPRFRSLRVGAIWDAFAAPRHAGTVLAAAHSRLARAGAMVVLASFADPRWSDQLRRAGFRPRGRDRHFLMSPALVAELGEAGAERVFLTFGDAEGHRGTLGQALFAVDQNV
ncbi:hypothetical protein [Actinoplanes teichomyceticus]|uniref:hypothetical protein n=1 Tax=Actinoplanes teichomyceticus TaxID=1867 RepID=UPI0013DDAE9E|nr:hypothetical protein [Actinoplanes teichomyceticus]